MLNRPRGDEEAQADELGSDPGQVGPESGGQSGDNQQLSAIADAADGLPDNRIPEDGIQR